MEMKVLTIKDLMTERVGCDLIIIEIFDFIQSEIMNYVLGLNVWRASRSDFGAFLGGLTDAVGAALEKFPSPGL